jgi:hypothetical protein
MQGMKPLLIACAVILATCSFAQDPAKQPESNSSAQPESCTVQGTVVAAATGEPLKSAVVVLIDRSHVDPPRGVTDANGQFVITGIPAGSYHFRASKVGYVEQAYHPDGSGGPAGMLDLDAGEKLDKVAFRLTRAAAIIGRVTDELGESVADLMMMALVSKTSMMDEGRRSLPENQKVPLQVAWTDDHGEYRLYNLPPGGYYVVANNSDFHRFRAGE